MNTKSAQQGEITRMHNKEMMNNTINTQQKNNKRLQKRIVRRLMKSKPTNLLILTKNQKKKHAQR
jgi:hypothetical protein